MIQEKRKSASEPGEVVADEDFIISTPDSQPNEYVELCQQIITLSEKVRKYKQKLSMYRKELDSRNQECYKLRDEMKFHQKKRFGFNSIKKIRHAQFLHWITKCWNFFWILKRMKNSVTKYHNRLSLSDNLLIVLMKLKLGLLNKDIAHRFGLKCQIISKIYRSWIKVLALKHKCLIVWPDRGAIRHNLPQCFKKKYRDAISIIDCSEIFIQRPTNLTARAQTWSNYKHTNTTKYLIGISPAGAVMFLQVNGVAEFRINKSQWSLGFVTKFPLVM